MTVREVMTDPVLARDDPTRNDLKGDHLERDEEEKPVRRPVWLLDVDGVLNASRPGWGGPPRTRNAYSGGVEYRIRWSPALLGRIRALLLAARVEIWWCSTWCPDAEQLEDLFDLPVLPRSWSVAVFGEEAAAAKLDTARAVLAQGRALIWTDDTEVLETGPVFAELMSTGQALLRRPAPSRGLQPADLDAVEAFLDRHEPTDTVDPTPNCLPL